MGSASIWKTSSSGLRVNYAWSADANTWWSIDICDSNGTILVSQYQHGSGETSGSGYYRFTNAGTYKIKLYVNFSDGTHTSPAKEVTVTVPTVKCSVYSVVEGVHTYIEDRTELVVGTTYYPNVNSRWPPTPSGYERDSVRYFYAMEYHDATSGMTIPAGDFSLDYVFSPIPTTNAYIWDGSSWVQAIPYIFNGSSWEEATSYIFDGSSWQS